MKICTCIYYTHTLTHKHTHHTVCERESEKERTYVRVVSGRAGSVFVVAISIVNHLHLIA